MSLHISESDEKDWKGAYNALKETYEEFQAESREFEEALESEITALQTQEQVARDKADKVSYFSLALAFIYFYYIFQI
jgi:hypothetical protein